MLSGAPTVTDVHVSSTQWTNDFYNLLEPDPLTPMHLGYRIPTGSTAQSKPLPWLSLNQVSITFSEDVNVQASDLSITGVNVPHVAFADFFYDAIMRTATWTLSAPLPRNIYHLDLDGDGADPVAGLEGNALDGEWINNTSTISGDGTPGGDFAFTFKALRGDVDQSGAVNNGDYEDEYWRIPSTPGMAKYRAVNDIDGNAVINSTDMQGIFSNWNTTVPIGSPIGVSNDAPTTRGFSPVNISNDAIDAALSLYNAFDDAETPDGALIYQVTSNTNPALFESVSINSQTGQLVINAASGVSGRGFITVAATDGAGQRVETSFPVHVNYVNQPPHLEFYVSTSGHNTWIISGWVIDDDDVTGLIVVFEGWAFSDRASVQADGTFTFAKIIDPSEWNEEIAHVTDAFGLDDFFYNYIGLS